MLKGKRTKRPRFGAEEIHGKLKSWQIMARYRKCENYSESSAKVFKTMIEIIATHIFDK